MSPADQSILAHFDAVRTRTRELLDCIPDPLLDLVAASEERSLADWFRHVCLGNHWWLAHLRGEGPEPDVPEYALDRKSLEEALAASKLAIHEHFEAESGAAFDRSVEGNWHTGDMRPTRWNGRERLLYLIAHEVHHRGKWVLTLRQAGVTEYPPLPLDW